MNLFIQTGSTYLGMNKPPEIPVTIEKGTDVVDCWKYIQGEKVECDPSGKLLRQNNGQITSDGYGQILFANPDFKKCDDSDPTKRLLDCKVTFKLDLATLTQPVYWCDSEKAVLLKSVLKKSFSTDLARYPTECPTPDKQLPTGNAKESSPVDPTVFVLPISLCLALVIAAIAAKKFIFNHSSSSSRKKISRPVVSPGQLFNSGTTTDPSSLQRGTSSSTITQLNNKIASLERLVGGLENDILSITQRLNRIESNSLGARVPKPGISLATPAPNPSISSTRYPLNEQEIKKAVLNSEYHIIANSPHEFLSETMESKQGLEDAKVFTIDGDQSNADQCSQSEFISVQHNGVYYLIPNILPNAANPARTIKRHADMNNIFSYGNGANIQNLALLPTLERTGSSYKLLSKGQIA